MCDNRTYSSDIGEPVKKMFLDMKKEQRLMKNRKYECQNIHSVQK